ncbi:hypothetical protein DM01DRAFT_1390367 [Hesseltinella vesiculosa]|uniref:Arrestin C-terminal-like domain-containing protein n=1 Tax=Hesseltinella vesiculosa TaxID=101127 RepID=A0A1X2GHM7_9FUNG|nr:hypothetical protein DM01DRAFT_1390367 [Hesseltinella vesiculosa]
MDIQVQLDADQLVLHGSPEEAGGVVLRGSLLITCREQTRIKAIHLKLTGNLQVHWVEDVTGRSQRHHQDRRSVMSHEWDFLSTNKVQHFNKGEHRFAFEYPIPGDAPASFQHQIGSMIYQLKAQVDRPTFHYNASASKTFQVSRVPLTNDALHSNPQQIQNEWADKLLYSVQVPHQIHTPGSSIPVKFDFLPLMPNLSVARVRLVLKEYIQFTAGDKTSIERRVLANVNDHRFTTTSSSTLFSSGWSTTVKALIPNLPPQGPIDMHVDTENDFIHAYHKLLVTVSLVNPDGHISELRVSIPIHLVEPLSEEDGNVLPAYEDAWRTQPYSEGGLSDSSSTSSVSSEAPLPWLTSDLTRVPSYSSALRTGRLYSYSGNSLPSYDSLAASAAFTPLAPQTKG